MNKKSDKKKGLWKNNAGITSIEIILILVILIAVIIIFKDQIIGIVESAFEKITSNTDTIIN